MQDKITHHACHTHVDQFFAPAQPTSRLPFPLFNRGQHFSPNDSRGSSFLIVDCSSPAKIRMAFGREMQEAIKQRLHKMCSLDFFPPSQLRVLLHFKGRTRRFLKLGRVGPYIMNVAVRNGLCGTSAPATRSLPS